ncbi:hypothetical protein OB996_05445 [Bacillus cereus]|nr:hypothetical protein [Bacillus cereus]MDA1601127.1 hypothetical protein [Bacillus cereus]
MYEHKYQVLDSETTSFYSDGKRWVQKVLATFYCEKCLDFKYKEVTINVGNNSERI